MIDLWLKKIEREVRIFNFVMAISYIMGIKLFSISSCGSKAPARERYLKSCQTLLQPIAFSEMQEEPEKGFDNGGFMVIAEVKE